MKIKRIFLLVADSLGIGELPDASEYFGSDGSCDVGSNTLKSISKSKFFRADNLLSLGLADIDGQGYLYNTIGKDASQMPRRPSVVARLAETSRGKDTTTGHFEIAGLYSEYPMPTYPDGFPDEVINAFTAATGRGVLCNKPYSGTKVIADYGEEHLRTGKLIIYTSGDSVFQIAAHNDIISKEELYEICLKARALLTGKHGVGRVIARPFAGTAPEFFRTPDRRDFSLPPHGRTLLDALSDGGFDVVSIGKICDIFAGRGITKSFPTHSNKEGMEKVTELAMNKASFNGLCFANLVDFDMLYGHRNDTDGYAAALAEFDVAIGRLLPYISEGDILMITADHGCDPSTESTDHSREYTPLIIYGSGIGSENGDKSEPQNCGTRKTFADIGATVAELLGVSFECEGESIL